MPFVNAKERHRQAPDTFEIPSEKMLDDIMPGDAVQVILEEPDEMGERFWLRVTDVTGEIVTGEVANHLLFYDLAVGEEVKVVRDNIINVRKYYQDQLDELRARIMKILSKTMKEAISDDKINLNDEELRELKEIQAETEAINERERERKERYGR